MDKMGSWLDIFHTLQSADATLTPLTVDLDSHLSPDHGSDAQSRDHPPPNIFLR